METMVVREGLKRSSKLVGVDSIYFSTTDFLLERGSLFSSTHMQRAAPVAVIGHAIKTKFFAREDPIGGKIKCGNLWLTVIGVLQDRQDQQGQHPASRPAGLQLRCLYAREYASAPVQEPDARDEAGRAARLALVRVG